MSPWRTAVVLLSIVLVPLVAGAAPAGKVVIAQGVDPTTLDMMNQQEQPASNVGAQIFESLLERDQSLKLVPALAAEMPKLVAPTTWEFKLRRGVKFHNGEDFNADAVKFSIERLVNPANKLRGSSSFAPIERVEIVDPYTVKIHTKKPWPVFLSHIALRQAAMYPPKEHAGKDTAAISKNPIGTGPFKFVQWVRDEKLVMEKNPDYWQGAPDLNRVTIRFIPEFSARLAALLAGEIDIMKDVPPHTVEMLDKSGKAKVRSTVSSRINYLALVNLKPGPMQDLRVRQAIHHAVNVDELIQQVLRGRATKMCGPLSPLNVDYSPKGECIKYDPARAQALFKEAGIDPTKLQLTLDTPSGRYPLDKDVSLAIAAQLQRIGIKVNVVVNEWGTHLDKIKNRTTGDMFFLGWGPALEAQGTIEQLFQATPTYSSFGNNKVIDAKIAQAVTIVDSKKRLEAWAELQQMVRDEVPWVFLWQQHDLYGVANWIEWTPRADEKVWMYEAKVVAR